MIQAHSSTTDAPLPARATAVLNQQLETCRKQLRPLLAETVVAAEEFFFERANKSHNNSEQQQCLASLAEIRRHGDALPASVLDQLAARIEQLGCAVDKFAQAPSGLTLALLADQSRDEAMVLDDLAARTAARASIPLFELGHRYAALAALPILTTPQQPFSPAALCAGFRTVTSGLELSPAHRIELYGVFDRKVLQKALPLYEALNRDLVSQGILPDLRSFAARGHKNPQSRSRRPGGEQGQAGTQTEAPQAADTGENLEQARSPAAPQPSEPPHSAPADHHEQDQDAASTLFASVSTLLRQRRQQAPAPTRPGRLKTAELPGIDAALAQLQQQPAIMRSRDGQLQPRDMHSLRRDMLAQLRKADPDAATPQLAPEQLDSMELMSMLFERLSEDIQSTPGSYLLSELQAPLLRVAMNEQAFFSDHRHPARHWLEKVAEASARWGADEGEDDGAPELMDRIHGMNRALNREFDGDVSLFEGMAGDLQKQLDQLTHRAEVAERRVVEAAQGRERLDVARRRARVLVDERLDGGAAPSLTCALLRHAWTDVLARDLLRGDEDGQGFRDNLAVVDALGQGPAKRSGGDDKRLCDAIEQGLAQVGMEPQEAGLLARAATGREDPVSGDSNEDRLTRTELATKLKQRRPAITAVTEQIRAAQPDKLEKEHAEAMAHIKTLAFGSWFEFDNGASGKPVQRKLAWYSTQTGRCLFVNRRGIRSHDTTIAQLANAVVTGEARLRPQTRDSYIGRAMNHIMTRLKNATGSHATQEQSA